VETRSTSCTINMGQTGGLGDGASGDVSKNPSVLKHSQAARQVGSSMKSALIHIFERVCNN